MRIAYKLVKSRRVRLCDPWHCRCHCLRCSASACNGRPHREVTEVIWPYPEHLL